MWSGPLHNKDFVGKVIAHVEENEKLYGTASRMKGMLTVAKEVLFPFSFLLRSSLFLIHLQELENPFYFTPSKVSSFFHCETPSLDDVAYVYSEGRCWHIFSDLPSISSALLNGGHKVSRSHACPGSIKTSASHREVHDIFRSWIKLHPVKMENISETSPARRLLAKESL